MDQWPNLFQHFSSSSPFSFAPSVFLGTPLFLSVHPSALLPAGYESFQHFRFLKQIRIHIQSVERSLNMNEVTFFRRCFWDVTAVWIVMNRAALSRPPYVSACTDTAVGSHNLNRAYCRSSQSLQVARTRLPLQNRRTHSEQPWQVKSRLRFFIAPFTPASPLPSGAGGQTLWCRGREGASDLMMTTSSPPVSAFLPLCCWIVTALGSCLPVVSSLAQMSLDEVASWEFPRVSKDGLNCRAPGWCCLKSLVTSLHLLALVPLKWNPTFSRNVELPHPGSKNTLIHQLLFKRVFLSKQQVPVARYAVLLAMVVLHFLCVKGFCSALGTFRKHAVLMSVVYRRGNRAGILWLDPDKTNFRNKPFYLPESGLCAQPWRTPSENPFPPLPILQTGIEKLEIEGGRGWKTPEGTNTLCACLSPGQKGRGKYLRCLSLSNAAFSVLWGKNKCALLV